MFFFLFVCLDCCFKNRVARTLKEKKIWFSYLFFPFMIIQNSTIVWKKAVDVRTYKNYIFLVTHASSKKSYFTFLQCVLDWWDPRRTEPSERNKRRGLPKIMPNIPNFKYVRICFVCHGPNILVLFDFRLHYGSLVRGEHILHEIYSKKPMNFCR